MYAVNKAMQLDPAAEQTKQQILDLVRDFTVETTPASPNWWPPAASRADDTPPVATRAANRVETRTKGPLGCTL